MSDQVIEYAKLLDQLRRQYPEIFRHLIGLLRTLLKP